MSQLAMQGGTPVHNLKARPWPAWPPSGAEDWPRFESAFKEVYLSRDEGLPHIRGRRFAEAFCRFVGAKYGVLTTCGSSALKLALCGVTGCDGLGDNGECIIPNYTFVACATTALEMGFSIRMVDVDYETSCMDPAALEAAITPRTRVIMAVHLLGHAADMDALTAIARNHKLKVLEDACQSHGAEYKGRKCGSIGEAGAFSFQSTKNLCCGEGGFLSTNDAEVYKQAYAIHNVGRAPEGFSFDEPRVGYNYRASEYLAALLEVRLKDLPGQIQKRNRGAAYLANELKGITGLRPIKMAEYCTNNVWHLYPMRYIPSAFGGHSRDEFLKALQAEGVPCSQGYPTLLSQTPGVVAVKKRHPELVSEMPCPNAERIIKDCVWFTQNMLLADAKDLADIPEAVRKIQKAWHA